MFHIQECKTPGNETVVSSAHTSLSLSLHCSNFGVCTAEASTQCSYAKIQCTKHIF
jgi:hypothetical protein